MADTTVLVNANPMGAMLRQIGLMVGIAAAVALGVAAVLWSQTPNYSVLYGSLNERDVSAVMDALTQAGIEYKVEGASSSIMVPSAKLYDARLKLAAAGLPRSAHGGMELLDQQAPFGETSERERLKHQVALEQELARTIAEVSSVHSARVHLAMGKQSVFARERKESTASVLVELYPGRVLEPGQVAAIAQLVASSVPQLSADKVTVVDQMGNLLTRPDSAKEAGLSTERLEYIGRWETKYRDSIVGILAPMYGADGVRAQVTADVDFTRTEQTSQTYNPDQSAVRSEQTLEEMRTGAGDGGVPGALSNAPPGAGTAPETTAASQSPPAAATGAGAAPGAVPGAGATTASAATPQSSRKQATKNFEVDTVISKTDIPDGRVRKLSVAVVVRNPSVTDDKGQVTPKPLSDEERKRVESLVKEAIGYDATRGDTINVIGADFLVPPPVEPLPEPPIWKQPWVWDVVRQVAGGLFALFIVLGVLRPTLKALVRREDAPAPASAGERDTLALPPGGVSVAELQGSGAVPQLQGPVGAASELERARGVVTQDARLAAQVVRNWVGADAA